MKKTKNLLLAVAVVVLFSSSCRKDENGITITRVIPVEMNANATYTITVPHAGDADDVMQITKQASHYLASKITTASGDNVVFEYTPAFNYVGADEVLISNEEGSHGQGGHGNCGNGGKHHHDDTVIYDFKISIKGTSTRSGN